MGNYALRMGKQMAYTSGDGAGHPNSFWCLDRLGVEIGDAALRLKFVGYHDAPAYDADRQPIAGAVKEYLVSGAEFMAAINLPTGLPTGAPISAEILGMAWAVALNTKDQGDGPPETRTSFFAEAVAAP